MGINEIIVNIGTLEGFKFLIIIHQLIKVALNLIYNNVSREIDNVSVFIYKIQ